MVEVLHCLIGFSGLDGHCPAGIVCPDLQSSCARENVAEEFECQWHDNIRLFLPLLETNSLEQGLSLSLCSAPSFPIRVPFSRATDQHSPILSNGAPPESHVPEGSGKAGQYNLVVTMTVRLKITILPRSATD